MGSSAAATCISAWVPTPPVMTGLSSTMVIAVPFLRLRDGTHPLAARTCEPRPLAQARQIRPAAPAGANMNLGPGRQIDPKDNQPGVSRFAGQTGTQARPYALTTANPEKQGRAGHKPILPAE